MHYAGIFDFLLLKIYVNKAGSARLFINRLTFIIICLYRTPPHALPCPEKIKFKFKFELKFKFEFYFSTSLFVLDGTKLNVMDGTKMNNTAGLLDGPDGETRTGA